MSHFAGLRCEEDGICNFRPATLGSIEIHRIHAMMMLDGQFITKNRHYYKSPE
jgi:hypothetical protein